MTVRFNDVLPLAAEAAASLSKEADADQRTVSVVRGISGQVTLFIDDKSRPLKQSKRESLTSRARTLLSGIAPFVTESALICASFFDDQTIVVDPASTVTIFAPDGAPVQLTERVLVGEDWFTEPTEPKDGPVRATFFGIKGGVGRSTALTALAAHAAAAGESVLVVDLDLESPGLGPILLGREALPNFGLVDYLVEGVVGQVDAELIRGSFARASLEGLGGDGEIHVAPAAGLSDSGAEYGAKLSRIYLEAGAPVRGLSERIVAAIEALEAEVRPTLTLIDSRAGIHDLAAIAVTKLGARTFLLGAATPQTFAGYRFLFDRWRAVGAQTGTFRERLKMVAALLPGQFTEEAVEDFIGESWDLFSTYLYDELGEGQTDGFSFDRNDEDGPHFPLRVMWSDGLLRFDPLRNDAWQRGATWGALAEFAEKALTLLVEDRKGV